MNNSTLALYVNPYLNRLFAFLPWFIIFIGLSESELTINENDIGCSATGYKNFLK